MSHHPPSPTKRRGRPPGRTPAAEPFVLMQFRCPPDLHHAIVAAVEARPGLSISHWVREACRRALEETPP